MDITLAPGKYRETRDIFLFSGYQEWTLRRNVWRLKLKNSAPCDSWSGKVLKPNIYKAISPLLGIEFQWFSNTRQLQNEWQIIREIFASSFFYNSK